MANELTRTSKFLSLVLRHKPEEIGIALDANGWTDVDELLHKWKGKPALTRELLDRVVAENSKKRFALSEDGTRIRANQGHSVDVDLALQPVEPPEVLYHGTATRFLESIRAGGLHCAGRTHVHLSADRETAVKVGSRHGKPVVLTVAARRMHAAGHAFFLSENGVWLTERVPAEFLGEG